MPLLPHLYTPRHAATSTSSTSDSRILDSRQLRDAATEAMHTLSDTSHRILKRIPHLLQSRQSDGRIIAIPTQYQGIDSGPAPGAVAGIILGSVAGFLLLLWILWILSSGSGFIRSTTLQEDVVVRRRSRSRGTTRRSHRTEMASRSPRRERVIRQERIVRDNVPPPREPSRIRETVLVDEMRAPPTERRVEGDDIVEVIEEHSSIGAPPRRKNTRRSSGYR
ncbi:glucose and ribitol dehydrogenase homolog 2-like [Lecanosticta acicola]|uniref:Glucose and ribitol dehydrogenase homolog 2-like n=1 Tax=Lecanosticta acicola TaxID=111012 RepID=A0AAI8YYH3_9PEZI|nr:glucose and ribitol dehydrogenase homolog 2-like [Lecanosticta acicola]